MPSNNTTILYILLGILIVLVLFAIKRNYLDNFIVFVNNVVVPDTCYNYFVTDGTAYYLLDTRTLYDGVNNPKRFMTKLDALNYLKQHNCPTLELIDLVVRKSKDDVTVSYERECAKLVAPKQFNYDICSTYADSDTDDPEVVKDKLTKLNADVSTNFQDYDIEMCMMNLAQKNSPELIDPQFQTQFAKFFKVAV